MGAGRAPSGADTGESARAWAAVTGWQAGVDAARRPAPAWLGEAVGIGLATPCTDRAVLLARVAAAVPDADRLVCSALGAAAMALSVALDGGTWGQGVALALTAADEADASGRPVGGPLLSARLGWATALAQRAEQDPHEAVRLLVGTGSVPQECVPAAFALASLHRAAPAGAVAGAVGLGGDLAAIAPLAGALAGAYADAPDPSGLSRPASRPGEADPSDRSDLRARAAQLLAARRGSPNPAQEVSS